MRPTKLLVFDLETAPDLELARDLNPDWAGLEDISVRAKLSAAALEKSGGKSDFLAWPYHKIVAIGCLSAEIHHEGMGKETYHFQHFGCIKSDDERELIEKFLAFGGRERTLLVSFNGIGFDLPVMRLRALKHAIACPWLFLMQDKWKNYFSRASGEHHDDLLEMLGGRQKMDEVATMIGLPGKLDLNGSWVADFVAEGRLQEVRDYCETDILNTYLLYLRHQHLIGVLSPEALQKEEARLQEHLLADPEKKHWQDFAAAWTPFVLRTTEEQAA